MSSLLAQALKVPSLDRQFNKDSIAKGANGTTSSHSNGGMPQLSIPMLGAELEGPSVNVSLGEIHQEDSRLQEQIDPVVNHGTIQTDRIGTNASTPLSLSPDELRQNVVCPSDNLRSSPPPGEGCDHLQAPESFLAQHSDFTIRTSNIFNGPLDSPPPEIQHSNNGRRVVFGKKNKYVRRKAAARREEAEHPPLIPKHNHQRTTSHDGAMGFSTVQSVQSLSPPVSPVVTLHPQQIQPFTALSPLTPHNNDLQYPAPSSSARTGSPTKRSTLCNLLKTPPSSSPKKNRRSPSCHIGEPAVHETIHAQSLLLGLAFMAIWTPNNIMAPKLTQMADSFRMDESERDLYLGSYCALAVGVLSLPISALFGILTDLDIITRKNLFCATVIGGSIASAATACSAPNFGYLLAARLATGGCMSGSVPVAFSILGDLFSTEERNTASSGLTAMMGLGIAAGQVYAGTSSSPWPHAFWVSSVLSLVAATMVFLWVKEPVRGAKEKALQSLLKKSGTTYDRQLTWDGFIHAMRHNPSNSLLIWQGFFTSIPWGIIFVFLNDFLSQEKGFSVPDATVLVLLFGIGCGIGGILGGYCGQLLIRIYGRGSLPLFMAAATLGGIFPFLALINSDFGGNGHSFLAMAYSVLGGCIASLPAVNIRPCLLNVNPPETRGAALTAANLLVQLARGGGPSCITLLVGMSKGVLDRQEALNITLTAFWILTAMIFVGLAKTLPHDQDRMDEELERYVQGLAFGQADEPDTATTLSSEAFCEEIEGGPCTPDDKPSLARLINSSNRQQMGGDDGSIVSMEDRMAAFDGMAARESIKFVKDGFKELSDEVRHLGHFGDTCGECRLDGVEESESDESNARDADNIVPTDAQNGHYDPGDTFSQDDVNLLHDAWIRQQNAASQAINDLNSSFHKNEETPLLRRFGR